METTRTIFIVNLDGDWIFVQELSRPIKHLSAKVNILKQITVNKTNYETVVLRTLSFAESEVM